MGQSWDYQHFEEHLVAKGWLVPGQLGWTRALLLALGGHSAFRQWGVRAWRALRDTMGCLLGTTKIG